MSADFRILIIDDDPALLDILNRAAKSSFPEVLFIQVYNSLEAKDYFLKLEGYGPKLVLLDINLRDSVNGLAFLAYLRSNTQTRTLPIIMLTVSQLDSDIELAYASGVSSFTNKPFSYEGWLTYLQTLRSYWFNTVTLPSILYQKQV